MIHFCLIQLDKLCLYVAWQPISVSVLEKYQNAWCLYHVPMMSLSCTQKTAYNSYIICNNFTLHPHYLMNKEFSMIRFSCTLYPENSIQFSVTPSTLSSSGEWVKVSWQDVKYPNSSDWIGVYSPPANDVYRIDPINHSPIKFQVCTNSFSIPIIHLFVN